MKLNIKSPSLTSPYDLDIPYFYGYKSATKHFLNHFLSHILFVYLAIFHFKKPPSEPQNHLSATVLKKIISKI
jgi:uncharacterized PurR-regulated membrane protein YhhQ (DUF165 family)